MSEREPIRFAKDLSFSMGLVSQRVAILGTSGGGKSYGASVLVESMIDAGAQVVIVDPMGTWFGLRFAKDGKRAGLSIPVLGGDNGDIPLEPSSGALIAKMVAEQKLSAVLDVSDMNETEKHTFVEAFARCLLRDKKRNRGPVMIVWEESDEFVPQFAGKDTAKMVGSMQRLVKQGRNHGVGNLLISQRPQAVSKTALNQCGLVFAFQTSGPHELKAVKEWVVHQGVDQNVRLNELPSLAVGTCFVWSPAWLKIFERVRVLEKRTLDTGQPPEFGDETVRRELPPVDMDALRKEMAATIEKAKAEDPKLLRKRIAELEAQVKNAPKGERVEVPVLRADDRAALSKLVERAESVSVELGKAAAEVRASLSRLSSVAAEPFHRNGAESRADALRRLDPRRMTITRAKESASTGSDAALVRGARAMLRACAMFDGRGGLTRSQVATLSGIAIGGGSFGTYLSALRSRGLIEEQGDIVRCTGEGLVAAGDLGSVPSTTVELVALWSSKLVGGARRMLETLIDVYPKAISRHDLGEAAGVSVAGGSFGTYLSKLTSNGLAERSGQDVRASESLFLGAAS